MESIQGENDAPVEWFLSFFRDDVQIPQNYMTMDASFLYFSTDAGRLASVSEPEALLHSVFGSSASVQKVYEMSTDVPGLRNRSSVYYV